MVCVQLVAVKMLMFMSKWLLVQLWCNLGSVYFRLTILVMPNSISVSGPDGFLCFSTAVLPYSSLMFCFWLLWLDHNAHHGAAFLFWKSYSVWPYSTLDLTFCRLFAYNNLIWNCAFCVGFVVFWCCFCLTIFPN